MSLIWKEIIRKRGITLLSSPTGSSASGVSKYVVDDFHVLEHAGSNFVAEWACPRDPLSITSTMADWSTAVACDFK